jgi:hypothetical protein
MIQIGRALSADFRADFQAALRYDVPHGIDVHG